MSEPQEPTPIPSAPPVAPAAPVGVPAQYGIASGPIGKVRGTGICIVLTIITLGIYTLFWWYGTHKEMKDHTGIGVGGGIAALIAFFVSPVMAFITSSEVGDLYERAGIEPRPVSGLTGLWYFPGSLILVGPIVWFIKTNGALNAYWRAQGAQG